MKGILYWISGVVFALLISPLAGKLVESYGEQSGWFDRTKENVDGAAIGVWQIIQATVASGAAISEQPWYWATLSFVAGIAIGVYVMWPSGVFRHLLPAQNDNQRASNASLQGAMVRCMNALHSDTQGRHQQFSRSEAEWSSTAIALKRAGLVVPNYEGDARAAALRRYGYLEALLPMVRDGHLGEARRRAEQLALEA